MARHIACLTFDFDAMSGFIARGMTSPTPISRGEFGANVGTPRILALLARHGIPATWFVPGHTLETYPAVCGRIAERGHEIGHHGWQHVSPALLTREREEAELVRANERIRQLTGRGARGYRSPSWDLSEHSVPLLLEHGFVYDSSMMGDDYTPYRVRSGDIVTPDEPVKFGVETPLVEVPISWSLDDYPHFEFIRTQEWVLPGLRNGNDVLQNWIDDYLYMRDHLDWGVITYTFHPFVTGRGHRMLVLEKLIEALQRAGAVFMTLEDAVDEYLRRNAPAR